MSASSADATVEKAKALRLLAERLAEALDAQRRAGAMCMRESPCSACTEGYLVLDDARRWGLL